jgi:hypothetical protein
MGGGGPGGFMGFDWVVGKTHNQPEPPKLNKLADEH